MEVVRIDTTGMRCPQPVLVLAGRIAAVPAGTLVEVKGDCPTFEKDVRTWAERTNRAVLAVLGIAPRLAIHVRA